MKHSHLRRGALGKKRRAGGQGGRNTRDSKTQKPGPALLQKWLSLEVSVISHSWDPEPGHHMHICLRIEERRTPFILELGWWQ